MSSGDDEAVFTFDKCFGQSAGQADVYRALMEEPMDALFDGYNCTVLAYGQTGSGKTHSMMGLPTPSDSGLIRRFGAEMIERAATREGVRVFASYVQLYNESFSDLVDPSSTSELKLRRSEARGVHLQGAVERRLQTPRDLESLLHKAEASRVTADTRRNASSSRSHAILTLTLSIPGQADTPSLTSCANLVDLAGSERYRDAGEEALRQQESISINQSLTTLGLVISTLAAREAMPAASRPPSSSHIPYRNSKLTHLLKVSPAWQLPVWKWPVWKWPVWKRPVWKRPVWKRPVRKRPVWKWPVWKRPVWRRSVQHHWLWFTVCVAWSEEWHGLQPSMSHVPLAPRDYFHRHPAAAMQQPPWCRYPAATTVATVPFSTSCPATTALLRSPYYRCFAATTLASPSCHHFPSTGFSRWLCLLRHVGHRLPVE